MNFTISAMSVWTAHFANYDSATYGDQVRRHDCDCFADVIAWKYLEMLAGLLRALNRDVECVFHPDRKDPHWGKRKLKRDARIGPMVRFEN